MRFLPGRSSRAGSDTDASGDTPAAGSPSRSSASEGVPPVESLAPLIEQPTAKVAYWDADVRRGFEYSQGLRTAVDEGAKVGLPALPLLQLGESDGPSV